MCMHHSREHCKIPSVIPRLENSKWRETLNIEQIKLYLFCCGGVWEQYRGARTNEKIYWMHIIVCCVHMYSTSHVLFLLLYVRSANIVHCTRIQHYNNNQYERNSMCKCNPSKKLYKELIVMLPTFVYKQQNENTVPNVIFDFSFLGHSFMPRTMKEPWNSIKIILGSVVFSVEYSSNELTADDIHKD